MAMRVYELFIIYYLLFLNRALSSQRLSVTVQRSTPANKYNKQVLNEN